MKYSNEAGMNLTFRPTNDRHAIQQVSFLVNLSSAISPAVADAIAGLHPRLQADLPRLERPSVFAFHMGDQDAPPPVMATPVHMKSFRRDGSVDWEVSANDATVAVHCFAYTRWEDVWSRARQYLQIMCSTIDPDVVARSLVLQYVDLFVHQDGEYNIDELIKPESGYVPAQVRSKGKLWHSHQGWFDLNDLELKSMGRVLHRVEFAGMTAGDENVVKVDHLQELRFNQASSSFTENSLEVEGPLARAMVRLHTRNKQFCADFLTADMQERVHLDG